VKQSLPAGKRPAGQILSWVKLDVVAAEDDCLTLLGR
jgi:hypothetical protein